MESDYCCCNTVVVIVSSCRKCCHGDVRPLVLLFGSTSTLQIFIVASHINIREIVIFQSRGIGDSDDVVVPLGESSRIFDLSVPEEWLI